jgi:hypothetical protein
VTPSSCGRKLDADDACRESASAGAYGARMYRILFLVLFTLFAVLTA